MQLVIIILRQILTMALYMLTGFLLYKTQKISDQGSKSIANILVWLVIPFTIINSFRVDYSGEQLIRFLVSFVVGLLAIIISMIVSRIIFGSDPINCFGASFSNAGFIGIPLIQESLGDSAVFLIVGMIVGLNILQWTYGIGLLVGNSQKLDLKHMFLNPIVIGSLIGFVIFLCGRGDNLPSVIGNFISGVATLNAPLAMLVLGVYLGKTSIKSLFITKKLYFVSMVRLLLIPVITIAVLNLLPIDNTLKMAILIAASAPAGANVAVYSQVYDNDYPYACMVVAHSSIFSIITLPLMILIFLSFCG